jgi:hypothetical protein
MENQDRRLTALHPALSANYDGVQWNDLNGWTVLNAANTRFAHETSLDLSGYSRESLTFFSTSVGIQDPGIYVFKPREDSTFNGITVLDIITSVPMDLDRVANLQGSNIGPGMLGSDEDFQTIVFGMFRFFTQNQNIPYPNYQQLERSQRFDSGEPTAADRLFCYRIINLASSGLDPLSLVKIPACRQLVAGVMAKESELVYMQRLKRGYELANQV